LFRQKFHAFRVTLEKMLFRKR